MYNNISEALDWALFRRILSEKNILKKNHHNS